MIQSNPIFFCDRLLVNENPVNSFTSLHTSVNHCCLDLRVQAYVTVHTHRNNTCVCVWAVFVICTKVFMLKSGMEEHGNGTKYVNSNLSVIFI